MIARLAGTLFSKNPPGLVVDVHGVGYQVEAPLSVFYNLPSTGQPVVLLIHPVYREDACLLFGFLQESDRTLFRELLKVSGVGPKVALAILSGVSGDEFRLMVEAGDSQALTRVPGIGKKTAERLVLEMSGRLPESEGGGSSPGGGDGRSAQVEARAALVSLGYSASEAMKMINRVEGEDLSAEALIRNALRSAMESR